MKNRSAGGDIHSKIDRITSKVGSAVVQPRSKKVAYLDTFKIVIAFPLLTNHPNVSQDLANYKSIGNYRDARIIMAH